MICAKRPHAGLALLCLLPVVCFAQAEPDTRPELQYGQFDVSWKVAELVERFDVKRPLHPIKLKETVTWRMFVPESYDPGKPAGLMVYSSPTPSGGMRPDWRPVIGEENVIWISANSAGNRKPTIRRILLAALAPHVAADKYEIDPDRVYLSGFSGGGKAAGIASIHLADIFKGAIFICGAELWEDIDPGQFAEAAANRYVFLTGSRDFNRTLTKEIHREFERMGVVNSRLMVIRGMAHVRPDPEHFREALLYLDGRVR